MPESLVGRIFRSETSTFYWEIPNFNEIENIGELRGCLVSPVFSSCNLGEGYKWLMKLGSHGYPLSNRRFLHLTIECLSDDFHLATITVGILKNNDTLLGGKKRQYDQDNITVTFTKFADRDFVSDPANNILNDGTLTIYCKIEMGPIYSLPALDIPAVKHQPSDMNDKLSFEVRVRLEEIADLENLINDHDFSDVKINIGDKTVMAHKCILAKRSPVFAAMFRLDMRELRNNSVDVKDIEYDIFMEMLRFVYSGRVHQLEKIAIDLLPAADMYQLKNLKMLCEIELMKQLSVDNAIQILKLADKYDAERLKKQTIGYLVQNRKDIFDQAEFRNLDKELMCEILQAMK